MNTILLLVGLALILAAGINTLRDANRREAAKPRWTVVTAGSGRWSFVDGEGSLYVIDFSTERLARERMEACRAEPPFDRVKFAEERAARVAAYKLCPP